MGFINFGQVAFDYSCEDCIYRQAYSPNNSHILQSVSYQESVTIDIDNAVIGLACVCEKHGENTQSLLSGNVSFFLLRSMMSNSSI